ncbi:MAG: CopG family transcriptional regulator [Propylenella sp.]
MRTTLDIDEDILEAAKELATAERSTAGKVLSDLARKGLTASAAAEPQGFEIVDGIPVLPSRGVVVTRELVDRLIEETELEDGRLSLEK